MRNLVITATVLAAFCLAGCSDKEGARAEAQKMEDACAAKDKKKALDIALKARESNKAFKSAFNDAFPDVPPEQANVCGIHGATIGLYLK